MFSVSDLRSLRLTLDEWDLVHTLWRLGADVDALEPAPERMQLDMLVLAGLVERDDDTWRLTDAGTKAGYIINQIFDWEEFAFCKDSLEITESFDEVIPLQVPLFV